MTNGWTRTLLGEVVTLQRGFDLPERFRLPGKVPIVSSSGITGFHADSKVHGPGVVTGRYGTLGEVFYLENDFWPLNTTLWVKDFKGNDPRFISYLLATLNLGHHNAAGAVPGLNRNALHLLPVTIPPPLIQKKIASLLCAYEDLMENITHRIRILDETARMIYREWFINLRFPGHESVKMIDSELGPIPDGWRVTTIDDLTEEIIDYRGKTPHKLGAEWAERGIVALSALNVKQGRLENLDKAKLVSEDLYHRWMKSELKAGDILLTSEAPLGQAYFLPESRRYCLSQRLFSIRAIQKLIKPVLLYFALSSNEGQKQIHARASGSTVLGIRQSALRHVPIVQPEYGLQEMADAKLLPFLNLIDVMQRKAVNLRLTRDLLLYKLVSGEIDLKHSNFETVAHTS
jgi:type I restriction enzyme S subunit